MYKDLKRVNEVKRLSLGKVQQTGPAILSTLESEISTLSKHEKESIQQWSERILLVARRYAEAGGNLDVQRRKHILLTRLTDSWDSIRVTVMHSPGYADLTYDAVLQTLLTEEATRKQRSSLQRPSANAAFKTTVACQLCKSTGHTAPSCPKLQDFSKDNSFKKSGEDTSGKKNMCRKCKTEQWSKDHWKSCKGRNVNIRAKQAEVKIDDAHENDTWDINGYESNTSILQAGNIQKQQSDEKEYVLCDSGATDIMVRSKSNFSSYEEMEPVPLLVATEQNGNAPQAIGKGTITTPFGKLPAVHIPDLRQDLVSVAQLVGPDSKAVSVNTTLDNMTFYDENGNQVGPKFPLVGKLYKLESGKFYNPEPANYEVHNINLWHKRLGHISPNTIKALQTHNIVDGLPEFKGQLPSQCDACKMVNAKKRSFATNHTDARKPYETNILELVVTDLFGPMPYATIDGQHWYAMPIIDTATGYVVGKRLQNKGQALHKLQEYIRYVERATGKQVKTVKSDGESSLNSNEAKEFFSNTGIIHQITTPATPQLNSRAERVGGILIRMTTRLLISAELTAGFWGFAWDHAIQIYNRIPNNREIRQQSRLEKFLKVKPSVEGIAVFGCLAYVYQEKRPKLREAAERGIYLGKEPNGAALLIWLPRLRKVTRQYHVELDEERNGVMYAKSLKISEPELRFCTEVSAGEEVQVANIDQLTNTVTPIQSNEPVHEIIQHPTEIDTTDAHDENQTTTPINPEVDSFQQQSPQQSTEDQSNEAEWAKHIGNPFEPMPTGWVAANSIEKGAWKIDSKMLMENIRYLSKVGAQQLKTKPSNLEPKIDAFADKQNAQFDKYWTKEDDAMKKNWNFNINGALYINAPFKMIDLVIQKIRKDKAIAYVIMPDMPFSPFTKKLLDISVAVPITFQAVYKPKSTKYMKSIGPAPWMSQLWLVKGDTNPIIASGAMIEDDSPELEQALNGPEKLNWIEAMIEALEKHQQFKTTGEREKKKPGMKILGWKWVLKRKRDADGNITKYKARIAIKGFTQRVGIDFIETFAPVVSSSALRLCLAIAVQMKWPLFQADYVSAFSHGELEEELYIPEFTTTGNGYVKDAIYVQKMLKALEGTKQGAHRWYVKLCKIMNEAGFSKSASEPCVFFKNDMIVAVHVDDMIIATSSEKAKDDFIKTIAKEVSVKDLGTLHHCLGWKLDYNAQRTELKISQQAYIEEVLKKFNMEDCNPVDIPMTDILQAPRNANAGAFPLIRSLVGALQWIAHSTRPDIVYAVNQVARHQDKPDKAVWNAAKRILRYLKGTKTLALHYKAKSSRLDINCYVDADFAMDPLTRKSQSGFIVFVNGCAVTWKNKKQASVAKSTSEAEYFALSLATSEVLFLRKIISELHYKQAPSILHEDNAGAIGLANGNATVGRAKHIDIHYHFLREHVQSGRIAIAHVPTKEQTADLLTKPMKDRTHFNTLRARLTLA
jgi:hypothetical protein